MTWGRNNSLSYEGSLIVRGRIKSVWPDLPTRALTMLERNLPDGVDPIPWVASLTDEEFAAFRMIGKGTLAEFRRSVPRPDDPGRAERAILDRAEAYRLVEEAREQRERAEKAERELVAARRCADLLVGIVRPMYAGPSGDQGLNDPRYLECKAAIESYRRAVRMVGGEDAR